MDGCGGWREYVCGGGCFVGRGVKERSDGSGESYCVCVCVCACVICHSCMFLCVKHIKLEYVHIFIYINVPAASA